MEELSNNALVMVGLPLTCLAFAEKLYLLEMIEMVLETTKKTKVTVVLTVSLSR